MGDLFGILMALIIGAIVIIGVCGIGAFIGFLLGGFMGIKFGVIAGLALLLTVFLVLVKNA